jgi:hypothetical protein
MYTTNTKSVADNTSVSEVWKFSTPSQTINSTVDCSRHVYLLPEAVLVMLNTNAVLLQKQVVVTIVLKIV